MINKKIYISIKINIVQIDGIIYTIFFLDDRRFSLFLNIKYKKNVMMHKIPNKVIGKNN
ncbi:hypothetical protein R6U77_10900 [Lysinibacillus louembei]|uniref:Uncharacterized protein n=1 Tax=Lysinibacillus louembei TaxID=1470088 RepID=A0ABZ0RTB5_9BACI|nr:hypothetical protein [Lysinibacillus louembei]WPK10436.1 hypothetical protein R6U77_10900 [Lysinibacillus louembei]